MLTWLHRLAEPEAFERYAVLAGAGNTCSTHTPGSPRRHTCRQGHLFELRAAAVVCRGCWQHVWPHSLQAGAVDQSSAKRKKVNNHNSICRTFPSANRSRTPPGSCMYNCDSMGRSRPPPTKPLQMLVSPLPSPPPRYIPSCFAGFIQRLPQHHHMVPCCS